MMCVCVLLSMCDDYANEHHIVFNAKKSKCMYSPPHRYRTLDQGQNPIFQIEGHSLEYVNEWPHLGHIVSAAGNDNADVINRRNILCGQINNVLCYFGKCQSVIRQKLLFAYCYGLYGNVLWDLNNRYVESVCVT